MNDIQKLESEKILRYAEKHLLKIIKPTAQNKKLLYVILQNVFAEGRISGMKDAKEIISDISNS